MSRSWKSPRTFKCTLDYQDSRERRCNLHTSTTNHGNINKNHVENVEGCLQFEKIQIRGFSSLFKEFIDSLNFDGNILQKSIFNLVFCWPEFLFLPLKLGLKIELRNLRTFAVTRTKVFYFCKSTWFVHLSHHKICKWVDAFYSLASSVCLVILGVLYWVS